MEIVFIFLMFLLVYTFLGYPLLLIVLSHIFGEKVDIGEDHVFSVTLIITAYNEESVIKDKIRNSLALDYSSEKLEIIVASDGSTDRTDEIVRSFENIGVKLNRIEGRLGKTEAQNQTVGISTGEIVVFSDANAMYEPDAIQKLVRNFHDVSVGGVCGRLTYKGNGIENDSESHYWNYEILLKKNESYLSSVVGANGSIYAVRKNLYVPLAPELISDLVEPLKVVGRGHRFVYEPEAISIEPVESASGAQLFQRKVRINVRTLMGLYELRPLLNFFKYGWISFQFISHKVLRYLVPILLILVFFANLGLLNSKIYSLFFLAQLVLYVFALIGCLGRTSFGKWFIFSVPYYFVLVHVAIFASYIKVVKGEKKTTWDTNRN